MQSLHKHSKELTTILTVFGVFSVLGAVYCVLALLGAQNTLSDNDLLIYGVWFVMSSVCVYGIFNWKKWGVYGLGSVTLLVAAFNILEGTATVGGMLFGLLVVALFAVYLYPYWTEFE